ncbi:DUF6011 domain-containing protein [Rhodococcus pyridinivorans]|uniref:DUF6011 domain-containing protein n=1 Tax=Rhodococcus pyridinivorans TaxID=103816 RepID=UPI0036B6EC5F
MSSNSRMRPAGNEAHPKSQLAAGYTDSSEDPRYHVPTPTDREIAAALEIVQSAGYWVAVRCTACGHPLVSPKSLQAHMGPKCAAREGVRR